MSNFEWLLLAFVFLIHWRAVRIARHLSDIVKVLREIRDIMDK